MASTRRIRPAERRHGIATDLGERINLLAEQARPHDEDHQLREATRRRGRTPCSVTSPTKSRRRTGAARRRPGAPPRAEGVWRGCTARNRNTKPTTPRDSYLADEALKRPTTSYASPEHRTQPRSCSSSDYSSPSPTTVRKSPNRARYSNTDARSSQLGSFHSKPDVKSVIPLVTVGYREYPLVTVGYRSFGRFAVGRFLVR